MKKTTFSRFSIDNSSILYLSLIRKDHTNTYRFTMTLTEDISPEILQMAVDRVYRRFPTVIAGFCPGLFHYFQVPAKIPPQVQMDPGCLITMSKEEIRKCAYRVYYRGKQIIIEAFHALADGYGAITSFSTLVAEYLRLKYGVHIPVCEMLMDIEQSPTLSELDDDYLHYENGNPLQLPGRYAYQLPGGNSNRNSVQTTTYTIPTREMLDAAHRRGVSITTLLSTIMAASIMEIQHHHTTQQVKPVRIMVPVDLRKIFPSRTLRNFILYTLPTMEPHDSEKTLSELISSFANQFQTQLEKNQMASIMARNVMIQHSWVFQMVPLFFKCALMRLAYRIWGENNSSITMTNLGNVVLPKEMCGYVNNIEVTLTPRVGSPYNCAVISYNGFLSINISRFPQKSELEEVFFRNLKELLHCEATK